METATWAGWLIPCLAAYLIGAVPFGLLIARLHGIKDIRQVGSKNVGATNVTRAIGFKAAVWVYVLDIAKGAVPALLAGTFAPQGVSEVTFQLLVGVSAILGHVFPVYLGFRGGKGVNTALGVFIVALALETLIALAVFIAVVALTRYISLGSILAALALAAQVALERWVLHTAIETSQLLAGLGVGLLVVVLHYKNIGRLLSGTESKFSFGGSGKGKV